MQSKLGSATLSLLGTVLCVGTVLLGSAAAQVTTPAAFDKAINAKEAHDANTTNSAESQATRFRHAMHAYETSHWLLAFDAFAALADEGHVPSARIALQMAKYGPRLYATRFEASAARSQRWLALAHEEARRAPLPAGPLAASNDR